jgi:hypothetical protein
MELPKQFPCYRISLWRDGRWKIYNSKTHRPVPDIAFLLKEGWSPEHILVEQRPGRFIKMPPPDGPRPRKRLRVVGRSEPTTPNHHTNTLVKLKRDTE